MRQKSKDTNNSPHHTGRNYPTPKGKATSTQHSASSTPPQSMASRELKTSGMSYTLSTSSSQPTSTLSGPSSPSTATFSSPTRPSSRKNAATRDQSRMFTLCHPLKPIPTHQSKNPKKLLERSQRRRKFPQIPSPRPLNWLRRRRCGRRRLYHRRTVRRPQTPPHSHPDHR